QVRLLAPGQETLDFVLAHPELGQIGGPAGDALQQLTAAAPLPKGTPVPASPPAVAAVPTPFGLPGPDLAATPSGTPVPTAGLDATVQAGANEHGSAFDQLVTELVHAAVGTRDWVFAAWQSSTIARTVEAASSAHDGDGTMTVSPTSVTAGTT